MNKSTAVVSLWLNGERARGERGQNLLAWLKQQGIDVPAPCYHPDYPGKIVCGLCLVEVQGEKELQTACTLRVTDGMLINTETDRIYRARKVQLKALFDKHYVEDMCNNCIWDSGCILHILAQQMGVEF